jgi:hypothetical protein
MVARVSPTAAARIVLHGDPVTAPAQGAAALPDRSSAHHERARTLPNSALRTPHPVQHTKHAARTTPATPGMGVLLRIGTSGGREISFFLDQLPHAPIAPRSGRAPPVVWPLCSFAPLPAAASVRPAFRPLARTCLRALTPDPIATLSPLHTVRAPLGERCFGVPAPATFGATALATPLTPERYLRSLASRPKGAAACPTTPFGGSNT